MLSFIFISKNPFKSQSYKNNNLFYFKFIEVKTALVALGFFWDGKEALNSLP